MNAPVFKGMATAMVTPMTAIGVDWDAFARFIDFQLESGINALVAVGGTEATDMAAKIKAGEGELLRHDLVSYSQFFNSRKNDQATQLASKVNDTYIKTSGDEAGTLSYGQVSDYLVNWYIQEIVAPTQTEDQQKFDPYDETQVDLSGLHSTPEDETQEDGE